MADSLGECGACQQPIMGRALTHAEQPFHPACLACESCKSSLEGISFYLEEGKRYCPDCHSELFGKICAACEKKIAGENSLHHRGQSYHHACFQCYLCGSAIGTKKFMIEDGKMKCLDCNKKSCPRCGEDVIEEGVVFKSELWHGRCFTCSVCNNELGGGKIFTTESGSVCGDCYKDKYQKVCARCSDHIDGVSLQYNNDSYHEACLRCFKCEVSLSGIKFYNKDGNLICDTCFK